MKARRGLVLTLLLAALSVGIEMTLVRKAAAREVSMALLAAGGALPVGALSLALATMLARLFVRLLLPGIVLQAIVLAALESRRPSGSENPDG